MRFSSPTPPLHSYPQSSLPPLPPSGPEFIPASGRAEKKLTNSDLETVCGGTGPVIRMFRVALFVIPKVGNNVYVYPWENG